MLIKKVAIYYLWILTVSWLIVVILSFLDTGLTRSTVFRWYFLVIVPPFGNIIPYFSIPYDAVFFVPRGIVVFLAMLGFFALLTRKFRLSLLIWYGIAAVFSLAVIFDWYYLATLGVDSAVYYSRVISRIIIILILWVSIFIFQDNYRNSNVTQ